MAFAFGLILSLSQHGVGLIELRNSLFTILFLIFAPILSLSTAPWLSIPIFMFGGLLLLLYRYVQSPILKFSIAVALISWASFGAWCATKYMVI